MLTDEKITTFTRRETTEIQTTELAKYFWKEKIRILIGLALGGVFSGFLCYATRTPEFVSKFLVQIDPESLPAVTDPGQMIPAMNRLVQSTFSQSLILKEIFANQKKMRPEQQSLIDEYILSETDLFVEGLPLDSSIQIAPPRNRNAMVELTPGTREGSFITVVRLSESGFVDTLGYSIVKALNKSIDSKNSDQYNIQMRKLKHQIEDGNRYAELTRLEIDHDIEKIDNKIIKIRSELTKMEFSLSKIAINMPTIKNYINLAHASESLGNPLIIDRSMNSQSTVEELGINVKTDYILRIISALTEEGKISQEYAKRMEDRLIEINAKFRDATREKSLVNSFEENISQRISEIRMNEYIDRSKVLLPRLKLDEEFYLALKGQATKYPGIVPLEKVDFDKKMKPFIIVGSLLGLLMTLSFLTVSYIFRIDVRKFAPLSEQESLGHKSVSAFR